ncbi:MAG: tryptophan synthase subunit alpha [Planctomycetia bacterium]
MNRIDALFAAARANPNDRRTAFLPFLTAGDPDLPTTAAAARALLEVGRAAGVPMLLEIGFPYSDPIADGSTIQASYNRALVNKTKLADIFSTIAGLRRQVDAPFVAMASYSLLFRQGPAAFLDKAKAAGFDGAIVPDLPAEESHELRAAAADRDFSLIPLVAPTTPDARAEKIVQGATGFIYTLAVAGITGERDRLPDELPKRLEWLRGKTDLPLCVGFGVGKPAHVAQLRPLADGVIVGSAIVRRMADVKPGDAAGLAEVARFVASLVEPLQPASTST